ncbi:MULTISPECIES: RES family NAD+ phosphorylase [Burkholderia]|uniref:RES family NAD+ phosphorylase n=1 Tax=Burkholderia TaxID=32008 RepID=UPI000559963F|nr:MULTISPECIES: RES family NAD+ phosphorylase [Burkholderia]SCZ43990.1 RES domain-containing protein [Burkholderia vietnamiensis]SFY33822.1 RES domain-containing protein [Burkholderia vietnamiensis]
MTTLWRISNYADLKGVGGLRAGGRWHFAGQPVVYLAEHPALALLETLVHFEIATVAQLPSGYQLLRIEASESVDVAEISEGDAPADWRENVDWTRSAGTEWLQTQPSALLRVPSVVVPHAHNFLLNPLHSAASDVRIAEVMQSPYDRRILHLFQTTRRD